MDQASSGGEATAEAGLSIPPRLLDTMPLRVHGVVRLNLAELRASGLPRQVLALLQPSAEPAMFELAQYALQRADEAVIGIEAAQGVPQGDPLAAIMVRGRFDGLEQRLQALEQEPRPQAAPAEGFPVLREESGQVVVRLDSAHLFVGDRRLLPHVLRAIREPAQRATNRPELVTLLTQSDFETSTLALASMLPEEAKERVRGRAGGQAGRMVAPMLNGIVGATGTLAVREPVHLQLALHARTEREAADLGGQLDFGLQLVTAAIEEPELRSLLSALRIQPQGTRIVLDASWPMARLQQLLDYLAQELGPPALQAVRAAVRPALAPI